MNDPNFFRYAYQAPAIAVDTESNARDFRWDPEAKCLGVSIAFRDSLGLIRSEYFPFRHWDQNEPPEVFAEVKRLIETHPRKVFHNGPFDRLSLRELGIDIGWDWYDTMFMVHWVDENLPSKELDWLGKIFVGHGKVLPEEFVALVKLGWEMVPGFFMKQYAANDAELTLQIYEQFIDRFVNEGYDGKLWKREQEFIELMTRIEMQGIYVWQDFCEEQALVGEEVMNGLLGKLDFNPGSSQQLGRVLIGQMGLPVLKLTPKGAPSMDKEVMVQYEEILESRADPLASDILTYRGWQKTVSSNYRAYLSLVCPDGKLRPNFNLIGTRTTRLSCRSPNLQQIPKSSPKPWNGKLKQAFLATPGRYLHGYDYANLELRLAAIYTKEQKLIDQFNSGLKIFQVMADDLGWEYDSTKRFVYATLYGGGVNRIKNIFNIRAEDAKAMRAEFFENYPRLRVVSDEAQNLARRNGYVTMFTGRRRHLPDPEDSHKAFNALLQGGAGEIVKSTMLALDKEIPGNEAPMLLQVHDEVLTEFDDPKWDKVVKEILSETVKDLHPKFGQVPFIVEGKSWS